MQRGNYQKKLEAMRAYSKTPAGRAAQQRSRDKFSAKRSSETDYVINKYKIKPLPLLKVIAKWK